MIDFNSLLKFGNACVACLLLLVFRSTTDNPYLDQETIVLALVLCAQTHAALMLERSRRDPLMQLLAMEMILYYSLRIFTLTLFPFSLVFPRYPYAVSDSNYALIFIIIANFFLYGGLYLVGGRHNQAVRAGGWAARAPSRVAVLITLAIVVSYFTESHEPGEAPSRIVDFAELFVSANVIILMSLGYYFLFRKSLGTGFTLILGVLIFADMIVHTLTGSRSAIVGLIQDCLIVGLAMSGYIKLRRGYVVLGFVLLPFFATLLVGTFLVSTYNRSSREHGSSFDLARAWQTAQLATEDVPIEEGLGLTLPTVLARVGYFDFSAELIAHHAEYRSVINLPVYGESIVDNILTPGFDVYDMPKVANALQFIYMDYGTPSKVDVPAIYQSDQLGIYGEFYALFGYACLPLMFLVAYLFKQMYLQATSVNPFMLVAKRVIILYLFIETLRSFGIDWVLAETVPIVTAIYLYSYFFPSRRPPAVPAPSAT
jgi:hypothetical protein